MLTFNGTSGLTFPDGTTQNTQALPGMRNRIINGDMRIDQRNAGASVTAPLGDSFGVDRWLLQVSQASKFTAQQNAGSVTPPNGFKQYLGITSSSAYSVLSSDYFSIQHRFEGLNVADFDWGTANASAVTLSFWVRSSLTGTFGGSIRNGAGTRAYPFTFTISNANTWERETIVIPGDTSGTWLTNNGLGLILTFGLGVGTTYSGSAGAWAAGNYHSATGAVSIVGTSGATFYITGVQLEKGSTATSFDYRPYGTELALCQRYYYNQTNVLAWMSTSISSYRQTALFHPVYMRADPTAVATWSSGTPGSQWVTYRGANLYTYMANSTGEAYLMAYSMSAEL